MFEAQSVFSLGHAFLVYDHHVMLVEVLWVLQDAIHWYILTM